MNLWTGRTIALGIVLGLVAGEWAAAETRTWTSVSGATVEAEFVEENLGQVVLRKEDGETIRITLARLIREDQIHVGTLRAGGAAAAKDAEPSSEILQAFGPHLVNARRQRTSSAELAGKKIGLYFSAQWCPPCRAFTPELVRVYEELKADGKPFEIVLVSHDRSEADMIKYMRDYNMPWLAIPHRGSLREDLARRHGVRGIPALVIVDENGEVLSADARRDVSSQGAAAFERW